MACQQPESGRIVVAADGTVWAAGDTWFDGWVAYYDETWQPMETSGSASTRWRPTPRAECGRMEKTV